MSAGSIGGSGGKAPRRELPEPKAQRNDVGGPFRRRWITAVLKLAGVTPARVERGLAYMREGRVEEAKVESGKIKAHVLGSRSKPYEVSLQMAPLDDATWQQAIAAICARPALAKALLSGHMPEAVDGVFNALGVSLFPVRETDLLTRCTCPDWSSVCKHVAALHGVLGDALDRDPFLLFELRGRTKEQVLEALRRPRASGAASGAAGGGRRTAGRREEREEGAPSSTAVTQAGILPEDYERLRGDLRAISFRFDPPRGHGAILKPLGQPASWSRSEPIESWLAPTYEAAGGLARDIASFPVGRDAVRRLRPAVRDEDPAEATPKERSRKPEKKH